MHEVRRCQEPEHRSFVFTLWEKEIVIRTLFKFVKSCNTLEDGLKNLIFHHFVGHSLRLTGFRADFLRRKASERLSVHQILLLRFVGVRTEREHYRLIQVGNHTWSWNICTGITVKGRPYRPLLKCVVYWGFQLRRFPFTQLRNLENNRITLSIIPAANGTPEGWIHSISSKCWVKDIPRINVLALICANLTVLARF